MLSIKNLHVRVEDKPILKGITLSGRGEVHAIMGPNGSGKSTLSHVLAGRDGYEVTDGEVIYNGIDLLELEPDERAHAGVFLAFQYPVEIPGVNNVYFLKAAVNAARKSRGEDEYDAFGFMKLVREKMKLVELPDSLIKRSVNGVFQAGKRNETKSFRWPCWSLNWHSWTRQILVSTSMHSKWWPTA